MGTPFALTATKHESRPATDVRLAWTDPSSTETGFAIERSEGSAPFAVVRTVPVNATSAVDTGRISGRTYAYRVMALHGGAEAPTSQTATVTMQLLRPAAPSGLTVSPLLSAAAASVTLGWKDNSVVEDSYEIDRSTNGSSYTRLATIPANTTGYVDGAVARQTKYWYRVRAKNATGISAYITTSVSTP